MAGHHWFFQAALDIKFADEAISRFFSEDIEEMRVLGYTNNYAFPFP
jgi:hypothetical protein